MLQLTIDEGGGCDETQEAMAYKCLWLAVIKRAKYDAEGRDMRLDREVEITERKRDAKRFLMGLYKTDLAIVCHFAGIGGRMDELIELSRRRYGMSDK
jgi:hypothetical protein